MLANALALLMQAMSWFGSTFVNEASSTFEAVRTYAHFSADDEYYFVKGGGLGWGMPAAVGIALHDPDRPVACFVGDGASMYSPQALWSAVNASANVKFIIFNNQKYDILMRVAKYLGFTRARASQFVGMTIDKPAVDFCALAETFSLPYWSADTISDLSSAVPLLFEHRGPAVLEVSILGL
ncbi:thiamine pyrophosphate-dependent enzyme [Bradyrhizobium canariense]|uniref:thiamine pyrophosphate-dependent enzyme n=1 Tax=Bradyrhizobium canariense TaxID=255045 RepID=UPI001431E530|nr:thiamine pyrophosphate-dependent enzyme [Bradyrhizobium canariense]